MNKKGLSLAELIITIALISVVVIFMYRLLVEINNQVKNPSFAINNQVNRDEIINYIQEDIKDKNISGMNKNGSRIIITADAKNAYIDIEENGLTYTKTDGTKRKWSINNAKFNYNDAKTSYENIVWKLVVPVYTNSVQNNSANNNALDDIIIEHINP